MILRGVLFRSTIRGGHASLAIVVTTGFGIDDDGSVDGSSEKVVLVIIRFGGPDWSSENVASENMDDSVSSITSRRNQSNMKSPKREIITGMRSNIRRLCKIGNELEFTGCFETQSSKHSSCTRPDNSPFSSKYFNNWSRFVVDYHPESSGNFECANSNVRLVRVQEWDATRCQILQRKYFTKPKQNQRTKSQVLLRNDSEISQGTPCVHHKSGLGKRQQGEIVADFLLRVISTKYQDAAGVNNISSVTMKDHTNQAILERFEKHEFRHRIVQYTVTNDTTNTSDKEELFRERKAITNDLEHVLDVAGGAGHVSLALTLRGVRSTVIDPRSTIGSLPGRDRKVLKKSKKKPFGTFRAWFGSRPEGIDVFFREGCKDYFAQSSSSNTTKCFASVFEPDRKEIIPVCTIDSEDRLLKKCTAIVALHPDEATGIIVETAVKYRIPFVVVLFPDRFTQNNQVVSTYFELIDWLVAKDSEIKVSVLPFSGANLAVWAAFQ